jgi:hypothetical protein
VQLCGASEQLEANTELLAQCLCIVANHIKAAAFSWALWTERAEVPKRFIPLREASPGAAHTAGLFSVESLKVLNKLMNKEGDWDEGGHVVNLLVTSQERVKALFKLVSGEFRRIGLG